MYSFLLRQRWWIGAALVAVVLAGIGRLIDPNWLYGNVQHCDTWYSLGQQVLVGSPADQQFSLTRQVVRVFDFSVGGPLYAAFPTPVAQFAIAVFWLVSTTVALSAATRRLVGVRGYALSIVVVVCTWPLYTAVATDFVNRAVVAALSVAVFGIVLSREHRRIGLVLAIGAGTVGFMTEPAAAPAVLGVGIAALLTAWVASEASVMTRVASTIGCALGGVLSGLALLVLLGNATGSAPGLAVVDVTWQWIVTFLKAGAEVSERFHVSLGSVLTTRPLAAYLVLLCAPGVAVLIRWLLSHRPLRAWRREAMPLHVGALSALAAAAFLQWTGASYISEDYYVVWFLPLALVSALSCIGRGRAHMTLRERLFFAGALAVIAIAGLWSMWLSVEPPLGISGPWILLSWAGIVVLAGIAVGYRWIVFFGLASFFLISGLHPVGYGDTAWVLRAGTTTLPYSPAALQRGAVDAVRLIRPIAQDPSGPAIWWLSDSDDLMQSRLPRATMQCPLSYPTSVAPSRRVSSLTMAASYAGYFVGAPRLLLALPVDGSPMPAKTIRRSMVVPQGQILMAVVGPGDAGLDWPESVISDLGDLGVRARLRGTAELPGGNRVAALTIVCPGETCRLPYSAPRPPAQPVK